MENFPAKDNQFEHWWISPHYSFFSHGHKGMFINYVTKLGGYGEGGRAGSKIAKNCVS